VGFAIFVDDGPPIVFVQTRIGRYGRPFTLYKFRSMVRNVGDIPSHQASVLGVTRVGRIIRRLNVDELPQLVNVINGSMSIVGPRPALPQQTGWTSIRNANGAITLRPGITGLAQVEAFDGMSAAQKAEYDYEYVRRLGLLCDIAVLARTVAYLARRPPVY
jgi:O-antigen biosynthesis protein WbqP